MGGNWTALCEPEWRRREDCEAGRDGGEAGRDGGEAGRDGGEAGEIRGFPHSPTHSGETATEIANPSQQRSPRESSQGALDSSLCRHQRKEMRTGTVGHSCVKCVTVCVCVCDSDECGGIL